MKFLCLICAETLLEGLDPETARDHIARYAACIADLRARGHYVDGNRLVPPSRAITVRVRDGRVSTTDGPFAETKEQLGGYFLIEAADWDEAIRLAATIPGAQLGCVEVRPLATDRPTLDALSARPVGAVR